MADSNSIPGFRFYPTEEELVSVYLHHKLQGNMEHFINRFMDNIIPVIDIYDFNPWDLPQFSGELCKRDPEQCFFFVPIQESQVQGGRPNRLTTIGYWKATGSSSYVYSSSNNRAIGVKRTMVFYLGRASNGKKTDWKMNEYKAILQTDHHHSPTLPIPTATTPRLRQEFSLCRVYKKLKCTRAFERTPHTRSSSNSTTTHVEIINSNINNVPITLSTSQQAHGHEDEEDHHHEDSNSYHMNPLDPVLMVERTTGNVQENSYSGDHPVEPSQLIGGSISGNNNIPLFINNDQGLWDWDDLIHWF